MRFLCESERERERERDIETERESLVVVLEYPEMSGSYSKDDHYSSTKIPEISVIYGNLRNVC